MKNLLKKLIPIAIYQKLKNLNQVFMGFDTPIRLSAHFVYSEAVEGDYLEFGVFKGASFIEAINEFEIAHQRWGMHNFINNRAAFDELSANMADEVFKTLKFKNKIRFFAFDSFAGLPDLDFIDEGHSRFRKGRYNYTEDKFIKNVLSNCVSLKSERVITIPGFFNETLNNQQKKALNLTAASVIMIDCDLYSSTACVLDFVTDLIQDGTILIFDDWYAFKGSPNKGQRLAAQEWLKKNPQFILSPFAQKGSLQRAFIINII